MKTRAFLVAICLGVLWCLMLVALTWVEWNNLSRDPLQQKILTPFIQREFTLEEQAPAVAPDHPLREYMKPEDLAGGGVQRVVESSFNTPLFLAFLVLPPLLFLGAAWLSGRGRHD